MEMHLSYLPVHGGNTGSINYNPFAAFVYDIG
jgi:hypothetical protein